MKILFIACYSPIINNSASIETLQYLNKLSEIPGNEVHLLTVDFPENSIYFDKDLKALIDDEIKVHLINGGKIFEKLVPRMNVSGDKVVKNKNIKKMRILRNLKNIFIIPDMYYNWAKRAAKYGNELHEKEKFDVMFSMHEPPSSHLCAYEIKKKNMNLNWITYWSDPWLKDSTREKSFFCKKKIETIMEKKIVNCSDKFVFVTEANRQDYIETYAIEKERTYIITRGYDEKFYQKMSKENKPEYIMDDKINILYAGEVFTKLRNINPFIEAVEEIKRDYKKEYSKLNILFFGNIDDNKVKTKLEQIDAVRVSKRISFNEAIKYMLNSEILLLFGNKNSKQIPAKIYEYLGAKGSILTIYGDENDPLKAIVDKNSRCTNTLNDKEKIKKELLRLIDKGAENLFLSPDSKYEWSSIVERLNKILEV